MRVTGGILCSIHTAEVIRPSVPSFCTPGMPARNLSVTSLPRPSLRNSLPGTSSCSSPSFFFPLASRAREAEADQLLLVDLAEVVVEALDLEPVAVRRHHAPRGQVVQRRAPQHRLLAAGIHGDVAADAGGIGRGRVAGEDQVGLLCRFHDAPRDQSGAGAHRGVVPVRAWQALHFDGAEVDQLFGVDHHRQGIQRHGAAGVAGAAAARDDGQAQFDAGAAPAAPFPLRCPASARRTDTRRASRWHR